MGVGGFFVGYINSFILVIFFNLRLERVVLIGRRGFSYIKFIVLWFVFIFKFGGFYLFVLVVI